MDSGQNAYFDIRVTNANSTSQSNMSAAKIYAKHEAEKKCNYNQRIMQVEHGSFTPLVFSVNGGMAPECEKFHKAWLRRSQRRVARSTAKSSVGYAASFPS